MRCPYNYKSETTLQVWKQNSDDNQVLTDGRTTTRIEYEYMECSKENCAAWHDGRCNYKA